MNFGFTEEQELLRSEVEKFVQAHSPMPEVRRAARSERGYDETTWRRMAELGWLGLLVPEAHGGAGLSWVDVIVLLEATGRALLPSPLLSTVLATAALAQYGDEPQRERLLPPLARGETIATVALLERGQRLGADGVSLRAQRDGDGYRLDGEKAFVADVGSAGLFVVAARAEPGVGLWLVQRDQPGVTARSAPLIDATKRMGTLMLSDVRVTADAVLVAPGSAGIDALERLLDAGAVAVAAEMIGAAEAAHALTVEYAKTRRQFGQLIGRFQGVKHPLAEMYVELETARSLVYYAAWALSAAPADSRNAPALRGGASFVARAASMAKAYASDAFARIGVDAIQLHGAIGYTDEYDAQLYLKRSKWARPQFGDADYHYDRVAALGGL
jgi:alkylation response protein AidB-like acyl-CoA dehydrogenase